MHAALRRLFLSFPPLHALSGDKGVPGSALLAVMDGSSVFHSGHGDWLLLINPLNDFKGKLHSPQKVQPCPLLLLLKLKQNHSALFVTSDL